MTAMRADSVDSFRATVSLAETDSTGRYQLENVPPGRYYITAGRLDVLTYYPGTLEVSQGLVVSIELPLGPVLYLQARLTEDQIKNMAPVVESLKQRHLWPSENQPGKENETETERDKRIKDILDSINAARPFRGAQPESPNGK